MTIDNRQSKIANPDDPALLRGMLSASARFRRRRQERFLKAFPVTASTRILDVGGSCEWNWSGYARETPSVTILNPDETQGRFGSARFVKGDGRDMREFGDGEFDIAFSNSVIEHLTTWEDQQRMAREIRRVARSYWVQTPNRHFPIEPHMCFPFFQYLPLSWRRVIGQYWPFSFEKLRKGDPVRDAVGVRLMTRRELQTCFPEATIRPEKFLGLAKSWIAIFRPDDSCP